MEESKTNLNCFLSPSSLPSWGQDQALRGHLLGAAGASVWPQSDTEEEEEERPFVIMEEEKRPATDDKWGETGARDFRLWEEATGCELYQLGQAMRAKEASSCRAGSPQELHQWEVAVRVAWGDGAQPEPYQWQENGTVQELPQVEKEVSDPKQSQQREGGVKSQEKQAHSPALSEEVPSAGAQSAVPAAHSPYWPASPSPSPLGAQTPSEQQEEAEQESVLAERESEHWTSAGDDEDWEHYTPTELSQECQGEAEPELSQGEVSSSQDLSEWEDCSEPELRALQDLSTEEDNSSCTDLTQDSYESVSIFSFGPTPLPWEDYEEDWDEVSVLELYEAEGSAQRLSALEADELAVPLPLEAWVERQAAESRWASLPSLYSEASVGQQGSEAGPQSPEPAPHSPLDASTPQPGAQAPRQQPAALSKRPGRLMRALRALRALFRCRCLAPRPQE